MGLDYVMVVVLVPRGHNVRLMVVVVQCGNGVILYNYVVVVPWGMGLDYVMVVVVPWVHGVRLCNGGGCTMGTWGLIM